MRSESAGGLMVKTLSQKMRDLGLSPSQHSPFPALNCSRENYLFNSYKQFEKHCGKMTIDR